MFDLNLRQAILRRVEGQTNEQLKETIEDAIDGDERALPGLGVLFEMIWKNSDQTVREKMIQTLHDQIAATAK